MIFFLVQARPAGTALVLPRRLMQRAAAMTTSEASAPGKLIMFGEHSVVYGYAAVAAALSHLRITASIEANDTGQLIAVLKDLPSAYGGKPVEFRASTAVLTDSLRGWNELESWRSPSSPSLETVETLRQALADVPKADQAPLIPLLFLCRALLPELFSEASVGTKRRASGGVASPSGLHITLRSAKLPAGAGLGSSAAFSVALTAALLRLRIRLFGGGTGDAALLVGTRVVHPEVDGRQVVHQGSGGDSTPGSRAALLPGDEARTLINGWAYAAECILHGTPSGLDNQVSCAGDAIRHVRDGHAKRFDPLPMLPALRILVTNTHVPRSTRALVGKVAELHRAHPATTTRIFAAIGAIADELVDLASGRSVEVTAQVRHLGGREACMQAMLPLRQRPPVAHSGRPASRAPPPTHVCLLLLPFVHAHTHARARYTRQRFSRHIHAHVQYVRTQLGSLITMNHHLLCALGVSCSVLGIVGTQ